MTRMTTKGWVKWHRHIVQKSTPVDEINSDIKTDGGKTKTKRIFGQDKTNVEEFYSGAAAAATLNLVHLFGLFRSYD